MLETQRKATSLSLLVEGQSSQQRQIQPKEQIHYGLVDIISRGVRQTPSNSGDAVFKTQYEKLFRG